MSIASPELLIIGAIIGAVVGGITAAINGGSFGDILMAVAIGAVVGAVSGGVYTGLENYGAMAAGMGAGAAGGATAGALGTAAAGGGKYFKNITNGAFFGAVAGAVTGGMMQYGGVDSTIAAMTGSFASGTMRGGIDDGLIAMAYAAGAMAVSYAVKGSMGEPKTVEGKTEFTKANATTVDVNDAENLAIGGPNEGYEVTCKAQGTPARVAGDKVAIYDCVALSPEGNELRISNIEWNHGSSDLAQAFGQEPGQFGRHLNSFSFTTGQDVANVINWFQYSNAPSIGFIHKVEGLIY